MSPRILDAQHHHRARSAIGEPMLQIRFETCLAKEACHGVAL
jgi:hypothetical protein